MYYIKVKMQKDPWGFGQLQTDPLEFQFRIITTWDLWIRKIDTSTKQPFSFLSKITATWVSRDNYLLPKTLKILVKPTCVTVRERKEKQNNVRLREKEPCDWERKRHAFCSPIAVFVQIRVWFFSSSLCTCSFFVV